MLCSNLGNENSDADHIKCLRGPHLVPMPHDPHPRYVDQRFSSNLFLRWVYWIGKFFLAEPQL